MKLRIVYAVRAVGCSLWLVDTCAGGTWGTASDATTFATPNEALDALAVAAENGATDSTGPHGCEIEIVSLVERARSASTLVEKSSADEHNPDDERH
jgi:hypothetical protein